MSVNKVEICGVNTSELPLLSEEEKDRLFEKMETGDRSARDRYIKGNLRLVLSVIQRFSASQANPDDLFQVGCIGLIKAVDNFDRTLNVRFSTYAVPVILGEIRRYLRDSSSIRVSRSLRDTAYKAIYAKEHLKAVLNREPTTKEISNEIDIPEEDIIYALDAIVTPVSIHEPIYQESGDELFLADQISDKKNREDNWIESLSLQEALGQLKKREYNIIRKRFFEGKTQTEIAEEISISQAQVSRLEKNALKSIRNYFDEG